MRYRWWVAVAGIVAFALTGAWLGHVIHVAPSSSSLMTLGIVLGTVAVVAFLRTMGSGSSSGRSHGS